MAGARRRGKADARERGVCAGVDHAWAKCRVTVCQEFAGGQIAMRANSHHGSKRSQPLLQRVASAFQRGQVMRHAWRECHDSGLRALLERGVSVAHGRASDARVVQAWLKCGPIVPHVCLKWASSKVLAWPSGK